MVDWGSGHHFGGHPHVVRPSIANGQKKLIITPMGNFISNQRIGNHGWRVVDLTEWTERDVFDGCDH